MDLVEWIEKHPASAPILLTLFGVGITALWALVKLLLKHLHLEERLTAKDGEISQLKAQHVLEIAALKDKFRVDSGSLAQSMSVGTSAHAEQELGEIVIRRDALERELQRAKERNKHKLEAWERETKRKLEREETNLNHPNSGLTAADKAYVREKLSADTEEGRKSEIHTSKIEEKNLEIQLESLKTQENRWKSVIAQRATMVDYVRDALKKS